MLEKATRARLLTVHHLAQLSSFLQQLLFDPNDKYC